MVDERVQALQTLSGPLRRVLAFSVATWLLVLAPSWYMLEVYDRVANTRSGWTLLWLTLAVLLLTALMQAMEWVRAEMLRGLAEAFEALLAPRVFRAAFDAVRLRGPGVRGAADLRRLREFANSPGLTGLLDLPGSLLFLLLLLAISPWVALVALVAAVVQVTLGLLQDRQTQPRLHKAGQHAAQAQQWGEHVLSQAGTLQAMGMTDAARARWLQAQRNGTQEQGQASWIAGRYQAAARFLQQFTGSALLGLGAWLLLLNLLPGGAAMMIVASILGGRLMAPMVQVVSQGAALVGTREAWQRLGQLLTAHPVPGPAMPLPRPRGELKVSGLSVHTPAAAGIPAAALLSGVNLALAPGEALVVLGPTGAGKSTLVRAVLGLIPVQAGSVRLDGVDMQTWQKDELGPALGYLPQSVDLLDGTLADNICRFGTAEPDALAEALAVTGLSDWVAGLPDGLQTLVGPNGQNLSAGQRQRVALARAVYGWPALVVMDEPNASLDAAGDAALDAALAALKARRSTVVVVSHRSSVLQRADKLLLLQEGQARAFGPRDEVLQALRQAAAAAGGPGGPAGRTARPGAAPAAPSPRGPAGSGLGPAAQGA